MNSLRQQLKRHFHLADTLERFILINVGVFLIVRLVNAISYLFLVPVFTFDQVSHYLAFPANPISFLHRPWTLITYMFYHWDVLHILFNMLWLYWMGKILQEYLGSKKILSTYFLGGICGGIFYFTAYNLFPLFAPHSATSFALGASASVLAITVAAATLLPEYPIQLLFFGNVKLKYIALVSILLDLISVSGNNAGGHIAHLGGALFGFIYIRQLKKGNDLAKWFIRLTEIGKRKSKSKMKVSVDDSKRMKRDEKFNVQKKAKQEIMDEILDKISRSGYGSLTNGEKEFLFKISKEEGKE